MAILEDLNTDQQIAVWGLVIAGIGIGVTIVLWWIGHKGYGKDKVEKKTEEESETVIRIRRGRDRIYRIFIGSPGGLEEERETLCQEIDEYSRIEANPRNVHFRPVRWEEIPSQYGRPQGAIDNYLVDCNAYVLILWDRWGSPPSEGDEWPFSSGSEEEFYLAEAFLKNPDLPMSKIAVYFKGVDQERWKYPNDQLMKIKEFKDLLKQEKKLIFGEFSDIQEFSRKIRELLAEWLRENEKRALIPTLNVSDVGSPGKRFRVTIEEIK